MKYSVETLPRMDADIKKKAGLYTNNTFRGENNFEKVPKVNGIELPTNDLNGTNYVMVYGVGTPAENAAELQDAYDAAKNMPRYLGIMSPINSELNYYKGQTIYDTDGSVYVKVLADFIGNFEGIPPVLEEITAEEAKSVRTTVIVAPGDYEFTTPFAVDASGIDVVSLTGNADVKLDGINVSAINCFIKGIDTGINNFEVSSADSTAVIDTCIGNGSLNFGLQGGNNYATYNNCKSNGTAFFGSSLDAIIYNCLGGESSFQADTFGGIIQNSKLTTGTFYSNLNLSGGGTGKVINCINADGSIYNNVKVAIENGVLSKDAVNKGQLDLKQNKFDLKSNNLSGITNGESLIVLYHIYKFTTNTDFDLLLSGCAIGSTVILKLIGNVTVNIFAGGSATLDGQDIDTSVAGTNYTITGSYNKITIYKDSSSSWITI